MLPYHRYLFALLLPLFSAAAHSQAHGSFTIGGKWDVNFNGYKGTMTFSRSGAGWTGQLQLPGAETLTRISFDPVSGRVAFFRPAAGQSYEGSFVGAGEMRGLFDGAYRWSALRQGPSQAAPPPAVDPAPMASAPSSLGIEGKWAVDCNGYKGSLSFARSGSGWRGVLRLSGDEELTRISFDAASGRVAFFRPAAGQSYEGTLSGNAMRGRFDGQWNWSAVRQEATPPQPPPPSQALDLNGSWERGMVHIWQEGAAVKMTATWKFTDGKWVIFWGEGTLRGRKIEVAVRYSGMTHPTRHKENIVGYLTVSEDGNRIDAYYTQNGRRYPENPVYRRDP